MFLDARRDPGPLPSYSTVAHVSFGEDLPFRATPPVAARFQALFTPLPGYFSAFPHGTAFAIGLGTYLALEVGAPLLPAAKPSHGTQGRPPSPRQLTPTGLSPSTAGASTPLRLRWQGRARGPATPHLHRVSPADSVWTLPLSVAPTQGIPYWFLLLPLLRCFRSGGSRSVLLQGFPERHRPRRTGSRKSHSGIPGSTAACASPGLIAACHALPRHPSRAIHRAAYARWLLGTHLVYAATGTRAPVARLREKEVIRPQVPLRPPCYDFSPLAGLRFDPTPFGAGPHPSPARVERRAVCARSRDVFTARW